MLLYGADNDQRLTGRHETGHMDTFHQVLLTEVHLSEFQDKLLKKDMVISKIEDQLLTLIHTWSLVSWWRQSVVPFQMLIWLKNSLEKAVMITNFQKTFPYK